MRSRARLLPKSVIRPLTLPVIRALSRLQLRLPPRGGEVRTIDRRADVYSLGVTLYEMLTGRVPYAIQTDHTLRDLRRRMQETPIRPSELQRQIPKALDDLILRLLSPIPSERPSAAELLILLLDQAVSEMAPGALERLRSQCAA